MKTVSKVSKSTYSNTVALSLNCERERRQGERENEKEGSERVMGGEGGKERKDATDKETGQMHQTDGV